MQYLIGLFTFLAVALALAGGLDLSRRNSRLARRLLLERDPYSQEPTVAARKDGYLERLEREALQAGVGWRRSFFLFCLLAGAAGGALLMLAGSSLSGVVTAALGALGPVAFVRYRARMRAEQFARQLPATLTLMANVIRAGGTLYQAVRAVVRQAPEPIRSEFARAEQAMQLQIPAAEALERIRHRIGLPEFTSVVIACKVAGEAGADLDRVLESIARELVEDRQFLKAMEAASAEGKASTRIVTAIPFAVMALVTWRSPEYFGQALSEPVGQVLIAGSVAAIAIGWLLIQQITDVRNW
jgi:tight adherence protein B